LPLLVKTIICEPGLIVTTTTFYTQKLLKFLSKKSFANYSYFACFNTRLIVNKMGKGRQCKFCNGTFKSMEIHHAKLIQMAHLVVRKSHHAKLILRYNHNPFWGPSFGAEKSPHHQTQDSHPCHVQPRSSRGSK
jgi:hypothetical protein